jgi:NADH-quinone oxidoreductase subunit C
MLLAKIKEGLDSLYDDLRETAETPAVEGEPEAIEETAATPEEAAPEEQQAVEEDQASQEEVGKSADQEAPAEETVPPVGPQETDYHAKGFHLDAALPPEKIVAAAEILAKHDFFIEAVTGVDWIDEGQMEVVYDFNHFDELCRVVIRTRVDRDNPEVPTISHIYQGANWHERETHDFFGIKFIEHPDLSPLLLPEDADFHPLRKDFTP